MPDTGLLLGVDIGSSRTKAVLVDVAGAVVASAAEPTPFVAGPDGVEAPVDEVLASVTRAVSALGPGMARVEALGLAGMAESGAPYDRNGRVLAPVIAWHDPRGAEVAAMLQARFGDDLARRLGQRPRAVSSVAKLGWLVDTGVSGVGRWFGVPELCLHALTGEEATDFSLAARTGAFDVAQRRPIAEVTDVVGVPADVFPEPQPAGSVMGRVTLGAGFWSGLPEGLPVTIAGHDHLVGMVGAGAGPGDLANSVGTAETVVGASAVLPDIERALAARAAVTLDPSGAGWAVLASAARAGIVVTAVAGALGLTPAELDRLAEEDGGGTVVVDATALVAAASAGEDLALPDAPPGAVWRGVLAALSARTWDAAGRVAGLVDGAQRLVVFGGGSRSRPWLAAKAAAAILPVVASSATEAVARGAALQAGVAAGWWPSAGAAPRPPLEVVRATG